ncbi:MAG: ATP-dependent DNA helicase RecG [Pseudomonadota bacterium]
MKSRIPMKETAEKALKRLGIHNLRDLLFYKPYSYNISDNSSDLRNLQTGTLVQAEVNIDAIDLPKLRRLPTKIYTSNDTGELVLVFFNKIPPFIFSRLKEGSKCIVSGKVQKFDGFYQINHPEFIFKKELTTPVEPLYHLTYGVINKQLYGYILSGISALESAIKARVSFGNIIDDSPLEIFNEKQYIQNLLQEIKSLHLVGAKAESMEIESSLNESSRRLTIKELFANQVSLAKLKKAEKQVLGHKFSIDFELQKQILDNLGFVLTSAQENAIKEIQSDQATDVQMMRLLQGDVGAGKTLVALMTMLNPIKDSFQAALMAPTDLLSVQHFQFFQKALEGTNIKCALLTGKTKIKERREISASLENGDIDILIGTHALFQESVEFKNLGYVIIDEQHRFGVEQRMELIAKASHPDVLVMTATPIPRSLTLTMFGDMSVSLLKAKPKNRLPIITTITSNTKKDQVIESLNKKIEEGQKIYWVCPLIDKNDKSLEDEDLAVFANVMERYDEIEKSYPGMVGILHGKMKPNEKDKIMQSFKNGEIKILIATTVIEVGIDVPDATLMIIENAEKFGLAQLHQLRGRVGRGALQSYCMLMYNPKRLSAMSRKRLEIMRNSNDGFYIAEQDLILRGGGEILGTKQSGEPNFFFADLARDVEDLIKVNKIAKEADISEFVDFQTKLFARDREHLAKSG